jgi:hypothetical protein
MGMDIDRKYEFKTQCAFEFSALSYSTYDELSSRGGLDLRLDPNLAR